MFNLHPSHLCRLCLLKKEKLKHSFQQRIFTSHWCWNIFVFKTLMLKYICLTLMLKYICLKRMSKYIFQLRETSPATGVSSAFSAAAAAVVVVTVPSSAAAVVVVVASASCPRVPAIPDRTNITCSQVWALFAPSWLQYTQVLSLTFFVPWKLISVMKRCLHCTLVYCHIVVTRTLSFTFRSPWQHTCTRVA